MPALRNERRVYLWSVTPRPNPSDGKAVTLEEIVKILEAEYAAKAARAYLSEGARLLQDDDPARDEKNQVYIAKIKRDPKGNTVTLLINRGDPNAVAPAFIDSETSAVRVEHPKDKESPGWSAHLVISTQIEKGGRHRACFEKMPHVSSALVLAAIDRMLERATQHDPHYLYEVAIKKGKKIEKVQKRYRPTLGTKRVPSENLITDLEKGELTAVTLTRQKVFYTGVGAKDLIKRQEEKVLIRTVSADKPKVAAFIRELTEYAKEEKFEDISFHLEKLPGGLTNNPTISLDEQDALEVLYVRAQRLVDLKSMLEACYADICPEIEEKMIEVISGGHGW